MQSLYRSFSLGAAALVALLGLTACTLVQNSSPANFYVLSADLPAGQEPLFAQNSPQAPTLVVGVVRVSAFLDRPQVTIRRDDNLVTFDEFVRWAEPLGNGVARVLRSNFVTLLGTPESALPWVRASNRDYNLFLFVEDIQQLSDHQVELRLSYRISEGQSGHIVLAGERTYLARGPKADSQNAYYAALAEVISAQLGQFAVDIAKDVARLKQAAQSTADSKHTDAAAKPAAAAQKPAAGEKPAAK